MVREIVSLEKLNPYYDEAGNLLNFTRQERVVIYFLIVTLGVGFILKLVRNQRLDDQLTPTRFYEEEQQFKEISAKINSGELPFVDSVKINDQRSIEELDRNIQNAPFEKINLNTADESELSKLPGIGPAIAKRIRAYTDQNGPFKQKEDIVLVKGIGKIMYTRIQGLVTTE